MNGQRKINSMKNLLFTALIISGFIFACGSNENNKSNKFDGNIKELISSRQRVIIPNKFKFWTVAQREGTAGLYILDYKNKNYSRRFIVVDIDNRKEIREICDSNTTFVSLKDFYISDSLITGDQIREIYESYRTSNAISIDYREENILFATFNDYNLIYYYNPTKTATQISYNSFKKFDEHWYYFLK